MQRKQWLGSVLLVAVVIATGLGLAGWKRWSLHAAASAVQPELPEVIATTTARARDYRPTTTAIGTVLALRSIELRNELPGTVRKVALKSGEIVEAGAVLLQFDTAVEEAELAAQQAEFVLAATRLKRARQLVESRAIAIDEVDQTLAQHQVIQAQIERTRAVIARKILRAPFRARIGIADVHPGQYLEQGSLLTRLQGVDDAVHVDFVVAQQVAAGLRTGDSIDILGDRPIAARIAAIDARVDPQTRNATVRARVDSGSAAALSPGASVRVRIASAPAQRSVVVPASALRRGPEGDHVFVVVRDQAGNTRARLRRVQTGAMLGDEVLIQDGLEAGERIAAAGSFKLRDDTLVALAGGDASAAAH